jgi:hypothetical protein
VQNAFERVATVLDLPRRSDIEHLSERLDRVARALEAVAPDAVDEKPPQPRAAAEDKPPQTRAVVEDKPPQTRAVVEDKPPKTRAVVEEKPPRARAAGGEREV